MRAAMPRPPRLLEALLSLAAAGGALLAAGCPSQEERVCDLMCDCSGCSEARYRECVDKTDAARQAAVEASCPAFLDEYLACVDAEAECKDDVLSYDGCVDQERDLRQCGVFVFRTVCEQANERLMGCGQGAPFGSGPEACPEEVACNAECIVRVSCDGLNGLDFEEAQRFNDCNSNCFLKP
ncbi:hypothetical protein BE20_20920 [Sorangium cellulosum]|uniref:Secreted protein n=1 Tax=Sorangium cellulosum TaxID=56 RepID=A0A150SKQ7_SORCE|nr:hypothetical protein BE20_20920 [Sorangium cellulosum]KYF93043.1 hypothetical protein BE18_00715 [Sorangium cellulosum]